MRSWGMETHGRPPRLRGWDYSRSGPYFVTFVVAGRAGSLMSQGGQPTTAGEAVRAVWERLPALFPRVRLDEMAIMSDHVHAVLFLSDHPSDRAQLGEVVRAWKAASTRAIRRSTPAFAWQSHYQDWVIRSQASLNHVRAYIRSNPIRRA